MELKLVVLAGAKVGTEIPLKKDEFFIGRAKECTLRAASEAISRRHCMIARKDGKWLVQDLKSRNGTHVNDNRIETATPLVPGDELRVGPLKFRVELRSSSAAKPVPAKTTDIPRGKQSAVKDVADIAERTAGKSDGTATEDDISRWLLGGPEPTPGESLKETRTIRMEETTTIDRPPAAPQPMEATDEAPTSAATASGEQSKSGGWFRRKGDSKKQPGKLPPRPVETTKDSREAAADILREMQRRR
jgi:pSer/pThr/pTyr-binding forkhead associated (FHA) protein